MNKQEYTKRVHEEKLRHEKENSLHMVALARIAKDYALANNTVNYNDIVTDNIGSIIVEKLTLQCLALGENLQGWYTRAWSLPRN